MSPGGGLAATQLVRTVEQDQFEHEPFHEDESIILHAHEKARSNTVAIFVHGYCGTPDGTWGKFPSYLFDDSELRLDVAMFRYLSGNKRFFQMHGSKPEEIERLLADSFSRLGYECIILVCHSMGGLLAKGAIHHRFDLTAATEGAPPRFGLMFLATPHTGSGWARVPIPSSDIKYLKPGARSRVRTNEFFKNKVWGGYSPAPTELEVHIPTCVVYAAGDKVVARLSASGQSQGVHETTVPGSHTSFIKSLSIDHATLSWCLDQAKAIKEATETPTSVISNHPELREEIVTVFIDGARERVWEDAFSDARSEVEQVFGVEIIDHVYAYESVVELALHVLRSDELQLAETTRDLLRSNRLQLERQYYHLGISPFGGTAEDSAYIKDLIKRGPAGAQRWIEETADYNTLRSEFRRWLTYVARNRPKGQQYYRSGAVRNRAVTDIELRSGIDQGDKAADDPGGYTL